MMILFEVEEMNEVKISNPYLEVIKELVINHEQMLMNRQIFLVEILMLLDQDDFRMIIQKIQLIRHEFLQV
jgi:hypothetical protein